MGREGFTNPVRNQLRSLADQGIDAPLRLVVAANQSLIKLFKDSGYDSPFDNVCIPINLTPWDEDMIRQFIEHRLRDNVICFEETEIQSIIQGSQGYPQRVMQLCYNLYQSKVDNQDNSRRP
ncbi:MAG: hypothetical protein AB4041_18740 [Microcystaceae cyanobacterium]